MIRSQARRLRCEYNYGVRLQRQPNVRPLQCAARRLVAAAWLVVVVLLWVRACADE